MLCYITDRRALEPQPLLPRIIDAIQAGVDLIQIREKDITTRELVRLVESAVGRARGTESRIVVPRIVVNDRLDVALAVGAAGVHLGTRSLPAKEARACVPPELMKTFLIGVSCHSVQDAVDADAAGADYVVLGPIFPTPSKLAYGPPLGLAVLREAASGVRLPILALGGVTVERVKACLEAGATGIAGISVFQNCDSLEERVRELRREFGKEYVFNTERKEQNV